MYLTMCYLRKITICVFVFLQILPVLTSPNYNDFLDLADDTEGYSNLSSNDEELEKARRRPVDPQVSWISFRKHSNRFQDGKGPSRSKKKKKRNRLRCPPGPMGPPGPRGPPGPAGAVVTQEQLMEEFNALVKETAEKRAEEIVKEKCAQCAEAANSSSTPPPTVSDSDGIFYTPRISVGFHMQLRRNVVVSGKTFMELKSFQQPFAGGAFHRGDSFNVHNGRFGAPRHAIYQFSLNLHVRAKKKSRRASLRKRDALKTQICIDSLCQQYASIKHVTGLESNSKVFTVSFTGFLELKAGQYASVYIDNASNVNVVLQSGSDFSGILVGL